MHDYLSGGAEGIRTLDLMNAIHALSQLSYVPNATLISYHTLSGESRSMKYSPKEEAQEPRMFGMDLRVFSRSPLGGIKKSSFPQMDLREACINRSPMLD